MNTDNLNYKNKYLKYKQKYLHLKNKLNSQTDTSESDRPQLMLFKAEWCGHCKNFKSSWEALKQHISNVDFVTFDADSNVKEMKQYGVQAFPTLMLRKNDQVYEFNQERNIDNIIEFVNENLN
tara:strand:+ start:119 stop:487 length:369 start_codon:yes stop_codon:yes gene_type:complete